MKQKKVDLFQFVDRAKVEKAIRTVCCFVYHDPQTCEAVATDCYILAASKQDYNPDLAGKLVNRFGDIYENEQEIEILYKSRFGEKITKTTLRYPKHMNVRPPKELYKPADNFNINEIKAAIKLWKSMKKEKPATYAIDFCGVLLRAEQAEKIAKYYTPDMTVSISKKEDYYTHPVVFECPALYILCMPVFKRGFDQVSGALYATE